MMLDRFQRPLTDLRISVIDQCNFRCPYCLPAERFPDDYPFLHPSRWLDFDQIATLVRAFVSLGLKKVKLTGGEPLLRPFLPDLVAKLKSNFPDLEVDLITNGYHLKPLLRRFKEAGLDRVTVSLDALDPEIFGFMNGRGHRVEHILDAIESASQEGFSPVKVNAVVIRGVNDHQVEALADYFHRPGFILRFIEYMDVGNINRWKADQVVPSAEILSTLQKSRGLVAVQKATPGETADRYAYTDGTTEIGFISSVSNPFCSGCSRARLSADGKLFTCLFAQKGHDLKALLKTTAGTEELTAAIRSVWSLRDDRYSELRSKNGASGDEKKIEMFAIGG